jgi:transposase-like protein
MKESYSLQYRLEAVLAVISGKETIEQVANRLNIRPTIISGWIVYQKDVECNTLRTPDPVFLFRRTVLYSTIRNAKNFSWCT